MLAPFATLVFIATLWLVAKLVFELIAQSGGRIAAALNGRPYSVETRIPAMRVRVSRPRTASPAAAQPQWRAAA